MTHPIDFDSLTPDQQQCLNYYALDGHLHQPRGWPKEDTDRLVELGLLVRHEVPMDGGLTVFEYEMPWAAHIAWCGWCAETLDGDGTDAD
jgi:hypothetical protein